MAIIEVKALSKRYKGNDFDSLKNANFVIEEGDIVGLVGKNGSGKSTLLKLLAKAQRPTEGTVFFKGQDIFQKGNVLSDFGIMIEPVFFPQISVEENLKLYLKIHQKEAYRDQIESILRLVDLWRVKDRKPMTFSFGMKQRTALALALITEPEFILLDEPFVGLDPIGIKNLLGILKEWSRRKKTSMIISSHQLAELEDLCTRYLFIDAGIIDDTVDAHQETLRIVLNPLSREKEALVNRMVADYQLLFQDNHLEVPHGITNEELNQLFEKLAAARLIGSIASQKDSLARLFKED